MVEIWSNGFILLRPGPDTQTEYEKIVSRHRAVVGIALGGGGSICDSADIPTAREESGFRGRLENHRCIVLDPA